MQADKVAIETLVLAEIIKRIQRVGPIPLDEFMRISFTHPVHGYGHKQSIGAGGDFITAPEISQVFGELVGLWCTIVWQLMGKPEPVRLIELGPGRGTLLRDALRAARSVAGFLDAATVHLIEISPTLRELQQKTLACSVAAATSWHEKLEDVSAGPAIIVGNEFLDALPIRQLVFHGGIWRERVVDRTQDGSLRLVPGAPVYYDVEDPAAPPFEGAVVELRAGEDDLLAAVAARSAPTAALLIDYGSADAPYGDTLQAVQRHAHVDPLATPGAADLTAHVRFAALVRKAGKAGLAADGPITQAEFLGSLGIAERASRLMAANPLRAAEVETAVQRLMAPTGMGGVFKVVAVRTPSLPPPPPFG